MKSFYLIPFLITTSMIALGQKMYVAPAPPPKGDTLYFIVRHTIKLEGKLANAIAAESVEALVSVKGNEITIMPRTLGEFEVTFIYKDSAVKRKFYSIYLPLPEKPKQSIKQNSLRERMDIKNTVLAIEKKVVDLTVAADLFNVKDFVDLYKNSLVYKKPALEFLSDTNNSAQQKMIAIYSMQKLSTYEYIDFAQQASVLFVEGKITEDLVGNVIASNLPPNYTIIENYSNHNVIDLLNTIKNNHKTSSSLKDRIDRILSGEAWTKVKNFKNHNSRE